MQLHLPQATQVEKSLRQQIPQTLHLARVPEKKITEYIDSIPPYAYLEDKFKKI